MFYGDREFPRLFHDGNLPGEEFRHRGHLGLAWLVLSRQERVTLSRLLLVKSNGLLMRAARRAGIMIL
jgi:hypothetical protein